MNVGRLRGKVSTFQRSLKENRQSWRSSRGRENSSPFYLYIRNQMSCLLQFQLRYCEIVYVSFQAEVDFLHICLHYILCSFVGRRIWESFYSLKSPIKGVCGLSNFLGKMWNVKCKEEVREKDCNSFWKRHIIESLPNTNAPEDCVDRQRLPVFRL